MNIFTIYIVAIISYVIAGIIFNKIFYRERLDSNNYSVFNLSAIAEYILISIYLALVVFQVIMLAKDIPIWYDWIFPLVWILYFSFKGISVFTNRNNYFKLNSSELIYYSPKVKGSLIIQSYRIYEDVTSAPSLFNSKGWFLELKDIDNHIHVFDLKDMNLDGFKTSMLNYFKRCNIKEHILETSIEHSTSSQ
jgi:hypothetical protein